jgi:hypothetical protein
MEAVIVSSYERRRVASTEAYLPVMLAGLRRTPLCPGP